MKREVSAPIKYTMSFRHTVAAKKKQLSIDIVCLLALFSISSINGLLMLNIILSNAYINVYSHQFS